MNDINPSSPAKTNEIAMDSSIARENWHRYLYGRDRGHIEYMEQAKVNEGMYVGGGRQWREVDKAVLREAGRPFYEFNEVMPSVNSALGYQIQNRMDIDFKPRGGEADANGATLISKVVKQVCDSARLHWHESQVYADGLIEQRGYFDVRMDFDSNIKGDIAIETLDPLDVIPDPDAKSYDPDGWGDVIVTRWLNLGQIEGRYGRDARDKAEETKEWGPDFGRSDDDNGGEDRTKFGDVNGSGLYDAYSDAGDSQKRYRLIDRQEWVSELTQCVVDPNSGDIKTVADLTKEQLDEAIAKGGVMAKRVRRRIKWTVSTYCAVIFARYSPYEHFTVVPYFAFFRRGITRGLVDNAVGPQEVLNKSVSQYIHIVNSAANSGWTVEQNSLTNMDPAELETIGAMTGLVVEYAKGSTKPEKIQPNQVPNGVDKMIDRATQALKDVTVPDSMRGLQGGAVSGVAKQADQFASQQQLAVPQDNLAYTRNMLANRLLKLVQRYYDSYRIFKITDMDPLTGQESTEQLEINKMDPATGSYLNDMTRGTYDVVVSEQPMHVTFENGQFEQAIEMREKGIRIPDAVVVRYSNLAEKYDIMKSLEPAPADPTIEAKAALYNAQARKADVDSTSKRVESQYSAIQTAQVIATTPATSGLADALLGSAGYQDQNAAPIFPEAPAGMPTVPPGAMPTNTNPMTPANPGVGLNAGIETPAADGVIPQ